MNNKEKYWMSKRAKAAFVPEDPQHPMNVSYDQLNSILPQLREELDMDNLIVERANEIDRGLNKYRNWSETSPGLFSNWDQEAGKDWSFPFTDGGDVPDNPILRGLVGFGERFSATQADMVGSILYSAAQSQQRKQDMVINQISDLAEGRGVSMGGTPRIYVYDDGTFDLYDNKQQLLEGTGHSAITAANILSFGRAGPAVKGLTAGGTALFGKMGGRLGGKLTMDGLKRLGMNIAPEVAIVGGYLGGDTALNKADERQFGVEDKIYEKEWDIPGETIQHGAEELPAAVEDLVPGTESTTDFLGKVPNVPQTDSSLLPWILGGGALATGALAAL